MEPTALDARTPPAPAPIAARDRIVLLDVIRGFALGGVFLSNVYVWFSGRNMIPREQLQSLVADRAHKIVHVLFQLFVSGKFLTIFSFFFGLGLAMQFDRAEARSDSVSRRYARRGGAMLLFGMLHLAFIWYGDILHLYALLGFAMLLFRRSSNRTLLAWGAALALLGSPLFQASLDLLPRLWQSQEAIDTAHKAASDHMSAETARLFADFAGSSYPTIVQANLTFHRLEFLEASAWGFDLDILGRMLLGMYAGRIGLFHDVPRHRRTHRRMLGFGLLLAVIAVIGFVLMLPKGGAPAPPTQPMRMIASRLTRNLLSLGMASVYMATLSLLFQRTFFRRVLSLIAPLGRMAVTNYLSQSVLAVLVFTGLGLGLLGTTSLAWVVLFPIATLVVQVAWSHAWLRAFQFGPVEWLWRTLTYGGIRNMPAMREEGGKRVSDAPRAAP